MRLWKILRVTVTCIERDRSGNICCSVGFMSRGSSLEARSRFNGSFAIISSKICRPHPACERKFVGSLNLRFLKTIASLFPFSLTTLGMLKVLAKGRQSQVLRNGFTSTRLSRVNTGRFPSLVLRLTSAIEHSYGTSTNEEEQLSASW